MVLEAIASRAVESLGGTEGSLTKATDYLVVGDIRDRQLGTFQFRSEDRKGGPISRG